MFDLIPSSIRSFIGDAVEVWVYGDWAMIAIAIVALVMFGVGMHLHLKMHAKGFLRVTERSWRRWIDEPALGKGKIGDLIRFATSARSLKDMGRTFKELRATETRPFERDLKVMKICVSAAPLLGLLGTVTGMLGTFDALATGAGGDETMELVAAGISEALVTTETGLVIALPGLFFQYALRRKHERYRAFLAHLETVCTQSLYRKLRPLPAAA